MHTVSRCVVIYSFRLLRTLELPTEPECLAFIGQKEDLLLGIRGDLYFINFSQILPQDLPLQVQQ